ncbi:thymidine phosphorylase family protein [Duganella fentianensis]|uniref:thymidine phosphorylase family protein n=1 Tax=Duganella fentianensis TaxID=2692177 RepID=UPI0032B25E8D
MNVNPEALVLRRLGIDTYQELVAYLRSDSPICRSEGFEAQSRIQICCGERHIIATLNVVHESLIGRHQLGLSEAAWHALGGADGEPVKVKHAPPLQSFSAVRGKIYGRPFNSDAVEAIVRDIAGGHYSDIEMAALITACSGNRMDVAETIALTRSMVGVGQRLHWERDIVVDKHCVGGLPGNRTTLIVVPIVAACGLTIPKTSSRAITSPAGSADTMETLAPVGLDLPAMRRVIDQEGGCIVWGGAVSLSPADDMLIRVERPLGLDSDGLLVASVLSKKIAAGSTHVVIDIPVGRTAKVRSPAAAAALAGRLIEVGKALGLAIDVVQSDGSQPVGRGIGPALEAWDVLAVLRNEAAAPDDLRQRAVTLAGRLLELGGKALPGQGEALACEVLASGAAWHKMQALCAAQGGMREPARAAHTHVITAQHAGKVVAVDNRRLARLAKLAGAPKASAAGLYLQVALGSTVEVGQPLYTLHAESPGELAYALSYAQAQEDLYTIEEHL